MNSRMKSAAIAAIGSLAVLLGTLPGAHAVRPDECEQQRKLYPEVWADVSHEQPLLDCSSHYSGALRVKLGATEPGGRTLMSLVPLQWSGETAVEDPTRGVFRGKAESELTVTVRIAPSQMTLPDELPLEPPTWMPSAYEVDERDQVQQQIVPQQQ